MTMKTKKLILLFLGLFSLAIAHGEQVPVAKVGDRVRVFTIDEDSVNKGVYPDWYDVLPEKEGK